jgi:formylglycine-generating enzyme required for sulfatase activity
MRFQSLIILALSGSLLAAEPYPLWDGKESVAEYAQKVNLPPTKSLDLGNDVKLDLVLIPAGKFIMGTPEPTPVDEATFQKQIITGQALLAISAVALLVMLTVVLIRAIRQKRRPQLSLGLLLMVTVAAGGCVLSGMHWRHSVQSLTKAKTEYEAAQVHYNEAYRSEKPAHPVTLTQPFYMGKFTVTQEHYQAVIGENPSGFKSKDNPVETVSWYDAQTFCQKLSEQTKQTVQLPTEAEWEYACRAGTTTRFYSGDSEADLARVAWYRENSKDTTHPVGQKEPNTFGLYDMHGNVAQWCQDWCDKDYYGKSVVENPQQGDERVLRGGSWYVYNPVFCRSTSRGSRSPDYRYSSFGFRVVLRVPSKTQ